MTLAAGVGSSRALWYLTRGSGLVALVLLTVVVVLGVLASVRWSRPTWPRFLTADLHRNVSLLVVVFVGIHVLTAVADSFAPIRWIDAVVPFGGRYRPVWVGLGAVAFDLLAALVVTSLLRLRLGHRRWRAVHWLAYACWPVAVLHGLGTGSDVRVGWTEALTWACVLAVFGAVWWRIADGWPARPGLRALAGLASIAVPLGLGAFTVSGPLQPGWARRAGTPPSLLASSVVSAATPVSASTAAPLPFRGSFAGTVSEQQTGDDGGSTLVRLAGPVRGSRTWQLEIDLWGQALPNGGVAMTRSRVRLTSPGTSYSGEVTDLSGARLVATLTDGTGGSAVLRLLLRLDGSSATGPVTVDPGSGGSG